MLWFGYEMPPKGTSVDGLVPSWRCYEEVIDHEDANLINVNLIVEWS
jgi:hypothetical protein